MQNAELWYTCHFEGNRLRNPPKELYELRTGGYALNDVVGGGEPPRADFTVFSSTRKQVSAGVGENFLCSFFLLKNI